MKNEKMVLGKTDKYQDRLIRNNLKKLEEDCPKNCGDYIICMKMAIKSGAKYTGHTLDPKIKKMLERGKAAFPAVSDTTIITCKDKEEEGLFYNLG